MANVILVLDGFGIGAMPDAGQLRDGDTESHTALSLSTWSHNNRHRKLQIPNLQALGLSALCPQLPNIPQAPIYDLSDRVASVARKIALGYPGADTFAGHQTLMGADMSHTTVSLLADYIDIVKSHLEDAGYHVEQLAPDKKLLIVNDVILVHDNLESDPGLNWNVSARLDQVSWETLYDVSSKVREVAPVARVICVGGNSKKNLVDCTRPGPGGAYGMDTPASDFYLNPGLKVRHLGADIDHTHQLPDLMAGEGKKVGLVGKAADILKTDHDVTRLPGVPTENNLDNLSSLMDTHDVVVANIQETDLAGHQQDPDLYCDLIERVDQELPTLITKLGPDEHFVIVADHGNDPTIGHSFHTREFVPALWVSPTLKTEEGLLARTSEPWESLADVGATFATVLGCKPLGHGLSRAI